MNVPFFLFTMLIMSPKWFKFLRNTKMATREGGGLTKIKVGGEKVKQFYLDDIYFLVNKKKDKE